MFILVPKAITDAMMSSSTASEPAATGETEWNAATSYVAGDKVIRAATHRRYENIIAGVNATPPEDTLQDTAPRWIDIGPTNRWAAFDTTVSTQSELVTPLTYVLRPGLFNAIAFYGLDGGTVSVSIKDAPGGTVVYTSSGGLVEPARDRYDYYFGGLRKLSKTLQSSITPYADPELTITITAGAGVTVKIGMIIIGNLISLVRDGGKGGTLKGATAEPVSYAIITTDKWGNTSIRNGTSATGMDARVVVPQADADFAVDTIRSVLGVPAGFVATKKAGYAGLNVFGLGSGAVSYEAGHAVINLTVKGMI